ncbi:MAG: phosphoethanolamine transferase [Hydrogenophaga sp.]
MSLTTSPITSSPSAQNRWCDGRAYHLSLINLGVALWLLLALNGTFWQSVWQATGGWQGGHTVHLLTLPLFVLSIIWLALEALTWGRAARPVLAVVLLASAAAGYFMMVYGVVFDRSMVANLVETHPSEATELMGWRLLVWLVALGAAPTWLLWRVRLRPQPIWKLLLNKVMVIALLLVVLVLLVAPFFQTYAGLLRNHRDLRLKLLPTNLLAASHSYARSRLTAPQRLEPVGADARLTPRAAGAKPRLLLLMVGETARASNFSLNGYPRPTNPRLSAEAEVISFRDVRSCGTSTAVSLPCMFLDVGREDYSDGLVNRRENLLDVLQRTGVEVLWRDNNSGCKGVCDRVPTENLWAQQVPGLCNADECWDEILLHGLQERIDRLRGDAVLVLHMKGSHGPAYHLRVPPAFEHFMPICRTNQLDLCQRETIVNAYDNTLRYTDHVLAQAITLLRANATRFDPAMLYVSDHGESLGENGLYLHGLPYAMAPQDQTHIPMLLWLPMATQRTLALDDACLRRQKGKPLSQDNLTHSVLGFLGIETVVQRNERNLFGLCKST